MTPQPPPVPPVPPYQIPQPMAADIPAPPPPPAKSRGWIVFVVLGVVLVGVIVTFVIILANLVGGAGPAADDDDDPPVVACGACVTDDQARALVPSESALDGVGMTTFPDYVPAKPSTAGLYADSSLDTYTSGGGSPANCWPLIDYSPVTLDSPDATDRRDRVFDLGTYGTDIGSISQVVRVFSTETAAADYPAGVTANVTSCPHYTLSYEDGSFWDPDVAPTALDLSSIVGTSGATAVGWDEVDGDWVVTVVDLQLRNIAIRTVYSHASGASATDAQFAAFLGTTVLAMASLD